MITIAAQNRRFGEGICAVRAARYSECCLECSALCSTRRRLVGSVDVRAAQEIVGRATR